MPSADPVDVRSGPAADRAQTLFEDYPGCPQLSLPPVQSATDPDALTVLRVKNVGLARWLVRTAVGLTGFERFRTANPAALEACLSGDDGSRPVTGPLFSAAVPLPDHPSSVDPWQRAARLLRAVWDLHADIRAGRFEPDRHGDRVLESRGYLNLFGTHFTFDGSGFRVFKTGDTGRLLVTTRGRSTAVDLGGPVARPSVAQLAAVLRQVAKVTAGADAPSMTLGTLSCAAAATQRVAFRTLLSDPGNRAHYELVKHSFALVCLDLDTTPTSFTEAARIAFSGNCANRWFHASLQVVVFGNARACLIFNPDTGLTGHAMMRATAEIQQRSVAGRQSDDAAPAERFTTQPLTWNVAGLPSERVRHELDSVLDDQPATFDLPGVGRIGLRARGFSPVELFVVAVQHATLRLTGQIASISQFISTTQHRCGGVSTAVVSTPEMACLQRALQAPVAESLDGVFEAAVASQRRACRVARSRVPLSVALALFRSHQSGLRRRWVAWVLRSLASLIRTLHLDDEGQGRDVVLSHPSIVPEVPMLGRPGVRLPYVRFFGLHYQILDDRTRLTVMPGRSWTTTNADLVAEIGSSLELLLTRLGR